MHFALQVWQKITDNSQFNHHYYSLTRKKCVIFLRIWICVSPSETDFSPSSVSAGHCAATRWRHWPISSAVFSREVWAVPSIPGRPSANRHPPFPPSCLVHSSTQKLRVLHDYWLNVCSVVKWTKVLMGRISFYTFWWCRHRRRCRSTLILINAALMHTHFCSYVFFMAVWKPFPASYYNHWKKCYL